MSIQVSSAIAGTKRVFYFRPGEDNPGPPMGAQFTFTPRKGLIVLVTGIVEARGAYSTGVLNSSTGTRMLELPYPMRSGAAILFNFYLEDTVPVPTPVRDEMQWFWTVNSDVRPTHEAYGIDGWTSFWNAPGNYGNPPPGSYLSVAWGADYTGLSPIIVNRTFPFEIRGWKWLEMGGRAVAQ